MKELEYPFDSDYLLKKKKSIRNKLLSSNNSWMEKKIAVLGGSTTSNVVLMLELFLLNQGIKPVFYESEYNQFWQDVMFDQQKLIEFAPDVIYIHTSYRNITSFPEMTDTLEEVDKRMDQEAERFKQMWEKIASTYHCPIIQNNFDYPPYRLLGNRDASDYHGRTNFVTRLNASWNAYAQSHENFYIHDLNYLAADYGLSKWTDSFYWHMYKYALCVPAIPVLAFSVANMIKSIYGKNKKALVLDLDNTLWGGIVGDDGQENLEIGQETSMGQVYSEFQTYIKAHKELGILLNINSKNEESNALLGLRHPDGTLRPEDFIVIKANWNPKDQNLLEIARELNLLPESLVFVDDNPAERHIVESQVPGVAVPELDKVENYIKILDKSGFFEVTNLSCDDLKRTEMYQKNRERVQLEASFGNYEEYLLSLQMKAQIKPFEPVYYTRISQLTNKSNQFNLTTKRYTQTEMEAVAADPGRITLYGKLTDRFGDNGVVSVVIGRLEGICLHLELWLMSCRVLKRDMEAAMMDTLVKKALQKGVTQIRGYYYPTAKNGMVKEFYAQFGFEKIKEDQEGNTEWLLLIGTDYENYNKAIQVEE